MQDRADDVLDEGVDVGAGRRLGADLAFGFGADVPHLPASPVRLHDTLGSVHHTLDEVGGDRDDPRLRGVHDGAHQGVHCSVTTKDQRRLSTPLPPLLRLGAGRMLRVPGVQGGLLGQLDRLDRRGRAAMFGLEGER